MIVVETNDKFGASIMSPSSVFSRLYNNPISKIIPVLPNTVTLSPILKGRVMARYNPEIKFPRTFWLANPITIAVIVPIDAAIIGSSLR